MVAMCLVIMNDAIRTEERAEDNRRGIVTTGSCYPRATLADVRAHQAAVARSAAEHAARAAKVRVIVALVPAAASSAEANALANELQGWHQVRRDTFADEAGARSPSETTWACVVHAVRNELP